MEELIKLVSQKVGVSEDMAKTAVNTVLGFLKDKLPSGVGSQVDSLLSGNSNSGNILESAAKGLGDIFSKS